MENFNKKNFKTSLHFVLQTKFEFKMKKKIISLSKLAMAHEKTYKFFRTVYDVMKRMFKVVYVHSPDYNYTKRCDVTPQKAKIKNIKI